MEVTNRNAIEKLKLFQLFGRIEVIRSWYTKHPNLIIIQKTRKKMESSDDSDYGESMLEMVEKDDLEFVKNAIQKRSYSVLNKVKCVGNERKKRRIDVEDLYEQENDAIKTTTKNLLPIKTSKGLIKRSVKCKKEEDVDEIKEEHDEEEREEDGEQDENDYELETNEEETPKTSVGLLAKYNESLRNKKVHIGYVCAGLLENPEEKVVNFRILFKLLDEETADAALCTKKLIIASMSEVFKDILPSYQIKQQEVGDVKLKKDTLQLYKSEQSLLMYYKKYLQKLEKFSKVLLAKGANRRNLTQEQIKIGEVSVQAMCDLLVAHPYFNYSINIAQTTVPFLNHHSADVRQIVSKCYVAVFKQDKKEELTLKILRGINMYLKTHAHNVRPDMLKVILHLKIKDINLDQEKLHDMKQKKNMSHKANVLQMSKKERKRKKRLKELEQEMLEIKAEESKQSKQHNLTEITKIVFGIFFRILKNSSNTKILGICLEGLAKYSHCINLEYYMDLLNLLSSLLKEDWLSHRDQLHCIQTVFTILTGQGDAINIDPTTFYTSLYKNILSIHAAKTYANCDILLKTISDAVIKRRKKITNKRLIGFIKRLTTLCLQILHNGSLSSLQIVKTALQLSKATDVVLDVDMSVGDGDYQPFLEDAEYCNAASSALYEVALLNNHYHPVVAKFSRHIAAGVPTSGEGSLPVDYAKRSAEELFNDFDMSQMAFMPAIPVPKKVTTSAKTKYREPTFVDSDLKRYCSDVLKTSGRRGLL